MNIYRYEDFAAAADCIRTRIGVTPEIGIVLGSGLGSLADEVENPIIIPYEEIPNWPVSTVAGHQGRLVIGKLAGRNVLVQQGRVHFYEGYPVQTITFAIRVMSLLGIQSLVITNAAGGVNRSFKAGDIMLINDHIGFVSLAGANPLVGPNMNKFGTRFPDMSQAYDREYAKLAKEAAKSHNIHLQEGVYTWVSGPTYESPAEIRFLLQGGTDAVGMSTVPEVIVARHCGIRVIGFSGITNKCSVSGDAETTHQEVLDAANIIGPKLVAILRKILPAL